MANAYLAYVCGVTANHRLGPFTYVANIPEGDFEAERRESMSITRAVVEQMTSHAPLVVRGKALTADEVTDLLNAVHVEFFDIGLPEMPTDKEASHALVQEARKQWEAATGVTIG